MSEEEKSWTEAWQDMLKEIGGDWLTAIPVVLLIVLFAAFLLAITH